MRPLGRTLVYCTYISNIGFSDAGWDVRARGSVRDAAGRWERAIAGAGAPHRALHLEAVPLGPRDVAVQAPQSAVRARAGHQPVVVGVRQLCQRRRSGGLAPQVEAGGLEPRISCHFIWAGQLCGGDGEQLQQAVSSRDALRTGISVRIRLIARLLAATKRVGNAGRAWSHRNSRQWDQERRASPLGTDSATAARALVWRTAAARQLRAQAQQRCGWAAGAVGLAVRGLAHSEGRCAPPGLSGGLARSAWPRCLPAQLSPFSPPPRGPGTASSPGAGPGSSGAQTRSSTRAWSAQGSTVNIKALSAVCARAAATLHQLEGAALAGLVAPRRGRQRAWNRISRMMEPPIPITCSPPVATRAGLGGQRALAGPR